MSRLSAYGQSEAECDAVHGGHDDILGLDGADVLFGDGGADFVVGDGYQVNNLGAYTPIERHGNDLLVGGAGAAMSGSRNA